MTVRTGQRIPGNPTHLARARYWIEKAEALSQHPNTAGKGAACAAIASAHAQIAQAALLASINTHLAGHRNAAEITEESE
ncbi:hypothetical protein GCM10009839_14530 [Catenulispora yoronensis]|uniref:Uncharacterized protein n=1 Tax=Catenulispora yoronensis TaxID=450799 RepID=A0ABN2TS59_9ACTN